MDLVYFTVIAIGLYFGADRLLDWLERLRGKRFENRQMAFFAIILPLALATFWLVRSLSGPGAQP
jgi:predicted PurR-regulated permease PerM